MSGCFFCCKKRAKRIKKDTCCDNALSALKIGESGKILGYIDGLDYDVKRRLLELGFTLGAVVKVSSISFLGDVLLFELNGYLMSLRKNIASKIVCKKEQA